jgi:hypothetical protein
MCDNFCLCEERERKPRTACVCERSSTAISFYYFVSVLLVISYWLLATLFYYLLLLLFIFYSYSLQFFAVVGRVEREAAT